MKIVKVVAILALVYVVIVVAFESLLGYFQPAGATTVVISTTDDAGNKSDRVVTRIDSGGHIYIAANHWPRAWYKQALEDPNVELTIDGVKGEYVAVPVTGAEHDRVDADHPLGPMVRFLTGFPPRKFVRMDPAVATPNSG